MNIAAANETELLRRLYSENKWSQLTQTAAAIANQHPRNREALRYWGIGELALRRGGVDKLLRAALLDDVEAPLWLGVLQEFSSYAPERIEFDELLFQVDLARLRRSPYLEYPLVVSIETLAVCNAACSFCPYPKMDRQGDRMSDELIDKIISDLKQIPGHVPFTIAPFKVNEPFLDKRIFSVCAKINEALPHADLRLFTNGSPLTEAILDKVAGIRHVTHLWVSLNEVEAQAYQELMQLPLERTLAKLDILHERVDHGNFPHPVVVSRVADGTEQDRVFYAFVQQRYPRFKPFMIDRKNWTGQVDIPTGPRVPPIGCGRWYELSIMASGKVALCCMDGEGKHVIGDINLQTALEVYNSPSYRKMRQFTFSRRAAAAPCDTCNY